MAKKINVLMCGGRRTGKTSIMAAMQQEVQGMFASGSIVLNIDGAQGLVLYQKAQKYLFSDENWEQTSYYASDSPTSSDEQYGCKVTFQGDYQSPIELNFIDVPGEWFVRVEFEEKVQKYMEDSQILVIAVDSPHLLEKDGYYHEVYNRPAEITNAIMRAFQGADKLRLVLFVPVKCELYRNNGKDKRPNMRDLLEGVKKGYADLIKYLGTSHKDHCAIVVSPCITMGGLEYLQFVAPVDENGDPVLGEDGEPLPDIIVNKEIGCLDMAWPTEYSFLLDANGDHFYKPEDCVQPLLNILLFFVAVGRKRSEKSGIIGKLIGILRNLPNQKILDAAKQELLQKTKIDEDAGYAVLHDPFQMMK